MSEENKLCVGMYWHFSRHHFSRHLSKTKNISCNEVLTVIVQQNVLIVPGITKEIPTTTKRLKSPQATPAS